MKVIYYGDKAPSGFTKSLFLAGPSLRPGHEGISWRKEALKILDKIGFDGVVFVPENQDGKFYEEHDYETTIEWEDKFLNMADCILFWIPRDLKELPGFTTNDEFGYWKNSGKIVLGTPSEAVKIKYQEYYAKKFNVPTSHSLNETIDLAIKKIGTGSLRCGAECQIPLHIWKTTSFQQWYKSHVNAGNRLDGAKVHWTYRVGANKDFVFLWIIQANMYIESENRNKVNEFVIARTDISSVVIYKKENKLEDYKIIIVKEFRSPVSNKTGFVWECPGGSSPKPNDNPLQIASDEVHEETGLQIDANRFKMHGARQLAATFSAHKNHLFSVEISDEELEWFKSQNGVHGNINDSEMTYVEIFSFKEILSNPKFDWTTVGMIYSVLNQ